jgi:hypothetical protein
MNQQVVKFGDRRTKRGRDRGARKRAAIETSRKGE